MKPLHGIRIVNLALNLPGPAAAQRLSRMGATLFKVEPPGGDPMSRYHPQWYRDMLSGHQVVTLDLKSPLEREKLDDLLGSTDLLITASRPAALLRLGLHWNTLHRDFPRLCQVAIVGYPSPRENEAGHDLTYQASLGLITPPHMPRTLLADMAGTECTVAMALALLLARERGGEAGYGEVALSEAAGAMAQPLRYGVTAPGAILGGALPEYNLYRSSDGWIAVAALEPHFKQRLESILKISTREEYSAAFVLRSSAEWQAWGEKMDVPLETVG